MRKIFLFYTFIFLSVNKTFAIPFLGVVPFVFDLSVFFIIYFLAFINYIFFYFINKIKILTYSIFLLVGLSLTYLIYLIGFNDFIDINLDFGLSIKYIFLLIFLTFLALIFSFFRNNLILIFITYLFIFSINFNLINDILKLKLEFSNIMYELSENYDILYLSDLYLNNIVASRDFYIGDKTEGNHCRLTLSFYTKNDKNLNLIDGGYGDEINIYTGICGSGNILRNYIDNL